MADFSTMFHPSFIVVVRYPGQNVEDAKIPPRFSREHLRDDEDGVARLVLDGCRECSYYVKVTPQGQDHWLGSGWGSFLENVRHGQGRMVLLLQYKGGMKFVVRRYDVNGALMYASPRPRFGRPPPTSPTIRGVFDGFVSDIWDQTVTVPVVPRGVVHDRLIADGAPAVCDFRWETDPPVLQQVEITGGRRKLRFVHEWERFYLENRLGKRRCCVFTYLGNLRFSVLVFDTVRGTLCTTPLQFTRAPDAAPHTNGIEQEEGNLDPEEDRRDEDGARVEDMEEDMEQGINEDAVEEGDDETPEERVPVSWRTGRSCQCTIQRCHGYLPAKFAQSTFRRRTPVQIKVQKSDGRLWRMKAVPSNTTHYLSKGYTKFRKDLSLPIGSAIELHVVDGNRLVFE